MGKDMEDDKRWKQRQQKELHQEFVAIVDRLMRERCCSKAEIARACGIISSNFTSYYTGKKPVSEATYVKVRDLADEAITLNERLKKLEENDKEIKELLETIYTNFGIIHMIEYTLKYLREDMQVVVHSLNSLNNNGKDKKK